MRGFATKDLTIINKVLPDYESVSKVKSPVEGQLYKAIDRSGDIYLIEHPTVWREKVDEKGRMTRMRLKPQLAMKYEDAQSSKKFRTGENNNKSYSDF